AATASTGAPHPRPTPRAGPDCSHDPPDTDEADEQEPLGQRKGEFSLPGGRRQRETQQGPGSTAGERPRQKGPPLPLVAAPASPGPQTTSGRPAPLPGTATGRARDRAGTPPATRQAASRTPGPGRGRGEDTG